MHLVFRKVSNSISKSSLKIVCHHNKCSGLSLKRSKYFEKFREGHNKLRKSLYETAVKKTKKKKNNN